MVSTTVSKRWTVAICQVLLALAGAAQANAQPTFSKVFSPNVMGPGGTSTLTFTIDNTASGTPAADLDFTDVLPGGVTIASPAQGVSNCVGTLAAPDGGGTISLIGGMVGSGSVCTITVDVTSAAIGSHINVSGDLTSSLGNSGTASDTLDILGDRPGFTKVFAPASINLGSRTTLIFTIDNSLNPTLAFNMAFTDNLPVGVVVADPPNPVTTCTGGTITASPGGTVISYGPFSVAAMSMCTISVDVVGSSAGLNGNTSGELTGQTGFPFFSLFSGGKASANLDVTVDTLSIIKSFTDDPVPPGGTVTLEFTVSNFDRFSAATLITFSDDLTATLAGLMAVGLPLVNPCGTGSMLTGSSLLSLTGGSLAAEDSCTFSVTLQVPAGATPGVYPNTTSSISGEINGDAEFGSPATDDLFVQPIPLLTKEFLDAITLASNPVVGAGEDVVMRFTITNTSTTSAATAVSFLDELTTFLPLPLSVTLPASPCGAGSVITLISLGAGQGLSLTGGTLAAAGMAGDSCTFDVTLTLPVGLGQGVLVNTTEVITAVVGATMLTGNPASDDLTVVAAPTLLKEFTDDPVLPGANVNLQFTLTHDALAPGDATAVTFTDDLAAALTGLTATGLPLTDLCGPGNGTLTGSVGDTFLTFSGATLTPGQVCTFSATLNVPGTAPAGDHTNTTSSVVATVLGAMATESPASDDLRIAGLVLTKEFTDDPVLPGANVTLQFTIDNVHPTDDATAITFNDDLDDTVAGLNATGLPLMNLCGAGNGTLSGANGNTLLTFSGGSLTAGTSCVFTVMLSVPPAAADGSHPNATGLFFATLGGSLFLGGQATDTLIVDSNFLSLTKEFTDDPAQPGGPVTLEFTLTNLDVSQAASSITFTDDLDAGLSGLTATGLPPAGNTCNGSGTLSGTSFLTFSGGSLAAGASCTFSATLLVPATVPLGTTATNTTADLTGTIGGLIVVGDPAFDDLRIDFMSFSKSFDGPTTATGISTLTFTIMNLSATDMVTDLSFSDDLASVIAGLQPASLPTDPCGLGSALAGTSFLTLSGGNLLPLGSCTFPVPLQVPAAAAAGSFLNTTSDLFLAGAPAAAPASATLTVEPPPLFSKSFAPNPIAVGQVSTISFSIDNSAAAVTASNLDFTDSLPAGMVVASPSGVSNACGGTVTATAGTGVISLTLGSVGAGATCLLQVNVTSTVAATLINTTGDLTSSSGTSGTASDTLGVNPQPGFSKLFAPNPLLVGGTSTLTFAIDNSASTADATGLDVTDNLPAAIVNATPASASTTCTGGTLTATDGASTITYTGGTVSAGASCTVTVDVTSSTVGTHVNTTGDLTSSLGSSGTATDTLTVNSAPSFDKTFAPNPIAVGATSTLTLTIDNSTSTVDATGLDVTDNLPAAIAIATPSNAATTCTGGTLTATDGASTITYTGGTVSAGASCTVTVDVTGSSAGAHVNTTGDLTSSLGSSGTATDTLTVNSAPSFDKTFAPDPIAVGATSTLTLTIDNSTSTADATGLDLTDNLPAGIVIATPSNAATTCTGGTLTATDGTSTITYTGGTVSAGTSCTVTVDVTGSSAGTHVNTTGDLTSSLGSSGTATDTLTVADLSPLTVTKSFVVNPVLRGGSIDLEYTITNTSAAFSLTEIAFTDDLGAAVPGLVAVGLARPLGALNPPALDVCGSGSQLSGTSILALIDATLAPGASCTFSATLSVPGGAALGSFLSTTGAPSAMQVGTLVAAAPASATLEIVFLGFSKVFADDPVVAGATTVLTFTITNPDPTNGATDITFNDDLEAVLAYLTALDVPQTDVCGIGSLLSGPSLLTLSGASLAPGGSCSFSVTVVVPATTPSTSFTNLTSLLAATVGSSAVMGDPAGAAQASLNVLANELSIPTLSTWGLLLLVSLLAFVALRQLRA